MGSDAATWTQRNRMRVAAGEGSSWEEGCRSAQGTGSWSQPCLVSELKSGDQCKSSMAFYEFIYLHRLIMAAL